VIMYVCVRSAANSLDSHGVTCHQMTLISLNAKRKKMLPVGDRFQFVSFIRYVRSFVCSRRRRRRRWFVIPCATISVYNSSFSCMQQQQQPVIHAAANNHSSLPALRCSCSQFISCTKKVLLLALPSLPACLPAWLTAAAAWQGDN
jgi:hypothetical protein